MMKLTIECAHTGDVFTLPVDSTQFDKLRSELSLMTSIPYSDQILLCGPPYKPLKTLFADRDMLVGKRIFLYDKRVCINPTISRNDPIPLTIEGPHFAAATEYPTDPIIESNCTNPRPEVLVKYLRASLAREVHFEAFLSMQISVIQRTIEKQKIQIEACSAAIENVNETFQNIFMHYSDYKIKIFDVLSRHKALLDRFDVNLDLLKKCKLHPKLSNLWKGCNYTGPHPSLFETIDQEKLNSVRNVNHENYSKIDNFATKLDNAFSSISKRIQDLRSSATFPKSVDDGLVALLHNMKIQECKVLRIRKDYQDLTDYLNSSRIHRIDSLERELLERFFLYDSQFSSDHEAKKSQLLIFAKLIENSGVDISSMVNSTMCSVAALQTELQLKLAGDVDHMRKLTTTSPNENIRQLDAIANLPRSQILLLQELERRQNYRDEVLKKVSILRDVMMDMRSSEIAHRKEFLTHIGSQLPPLFFEIIPSLTHKPIFVEMTLSGDDLTVPFIETGEIVTFLQELPSELANLKGIMLQQIQEESSPDHTCNKSIQTGSTILEKSLIQTSNELEIRLANLEEENNKLKLQISELQFNLDQQLNSSCVATDGSSVNIAFQLEGDSNVPTERNADIPITMFMPWLRYLSVILDPGHLNISKLVHYENFTLFSCGGYFHESETVGNQLEWVTRRILALLNDYCTLTKFSTLSFLNFEVGNLALFMPTEDNADDQGIWVAFSCNCPHRYLAEESLASFMRRKKKHAGYLIGKITKIEEKVAENESFSTPFKLSSGVKYFIVHARPVKFSSMSSSKQHA